MTKKLRRNKSKIKKQNKKIPLLIIVIIFIGIIASLLLFRSHFQKSEINVDNITPTAFPTSVIIETQKVDTSSWNIYTAPGNFYSLLYPSNWIVEVNPSHPGNLRQNPENEKRNDVHVNKNKLILIYYLFFYIKGFKKNNIVFDYIKINYILNKEN